MQLLKALKSLPQLKTETTSELIFFLAFENICTVLKNYPTTLNKKIFFLSVKNLKKALPDICQFNY
jgi:hypothetical protein